jgi:hypothetical protein
MTATATTDTSAGASTAGEPRELARYTTATGTARVLGGQRVDGVVRFLPGDGVVLVPQQGVSEDDARSSRRVPTPPARRDAARRKRPNSTGRRHLPHWGRCVMTTTATTRARRTRRPC